MILILFLEFYLYVSQHQLNNMEYESPQRFPLNLTRGRVIQHPTHRYQRSPNVNLEVSNNETNEMQVSTIQLREESYGNENNQRISRNHRLDLTDYTSPPSYVEATSAIPETVSSEG